MRVDGDRDVLDAPHVVAEALDARTEGSRHLVAGGIGNVHDGRPGLDDGLDDALEETLVGSSGILGVELDVLDVALGVPDAADGPLDALVLADAELVGQMLRGYAEARVDAWALGA